MKSRLVNGLLAVARRVAPPGFFTSDRNQIPYGVEPSHRPSRFGDENVSVVQEERDIAGLQRIKAGIPAGLSDFDELGPGGQGILVHTARTLALGAAGAPWPKRRLQLISLGKGQAQPRIGADVISCRARASPLFCPRPDRLDRCR